MIDHTEDEHIDVTKIYGSTDVNFGALTSKLIENLQDQDVNIHYKNTVEDVKQTPDGTWEVKVRNFAEGTIEYHTAKFVFVGAGGGALPLLQKTGIPESKKVDAIPVSDVSFVCNNQKVTEQHIAIVYGKASVGAPLMSVPNLDTRYIDNERTLLFGPFAGFSPKFLKSGSYLDLIGSVKPNNVITMLAAGAKNVSLTKYLVQQLMLSKEQRMEEV